MSEGMGEDMLDVTRISSKVILVLVISLLVSALVLWLLITQLSRHVPIHGVFV